LQVTERIYGIPVAAGGHMGPAPPNAWLVAVGRAIPLRGSPGLGGSGTKGGEGILIDAGLGDEETAASCLEYIRGLGVGLVWIVLTHSHTDHAGGADALRRATGAPIAMHRQEAPFVGRGPDDFDLPPGAQERLRAQREAAARATPDRLLEDGDALAVGDLTLEAIHTPGHTLGSLCLYLRQERALFTGDTVLGLGTGVVLPPPYGDMALYLDSLQRLLTWDAALLLPGHGPLVRQPAQKIAELIEHRREREEQLLTALGRGQRTLDQLLRQIYPELTSNLTSMARQQIISHMEKLRQEGRVTVEGQGKEAVYFAG